MDKQTQELMERAKFLQSDDMRKMQTKLTKTANSIVNDGLHYKLEPFYTEEERNILMQAAEILHSVKSKVEHVKEIKAREEKKAKAHRERCAEAREEIIMNEFPKPERPDQYRDVLLWRLAIAFFARDIFELYKYVPEIDYVRKDIERWSEKEAEYRTVETLEGSVNGWWRDVTNDIGDAFQSGEMPDRQIIVDLKKRFNASWRQKLEVQFADILQAFDAEITAMNSDNVVKLRSIKPR